MLVEPPWEAHRTPQLAVGFGRGVTEGHGRAVEAGVHFHYTMVCVCVCAVCVCVCVCVIPTMIKLRNVSER